MEWLGSQGYGVYYPIGHSPDCDLVIDDGHAFRRVQVKTTSRHNNRRWEVMLCTRGGNQSWSGTVKLFSAARCDWLFAVVADGRRWFIPAGSVVGRSKISLEGRYTASSRSTRAVRCSLHRTSNRYPRDAQAGFLSGQKGSAVNRLALPSQVRILPPPSLWSRRLEHALERNRRRLRRARCPSSSAPGSPAWRSAPGSVRPRSTTSSSARRRPTGRPSSASRWRCSRASSSTRCSPISTSTSSPSAGFFSTRTRR